MFLKIHKTAHQDWNNAKYSSNIGLASCYENCEEVIYDYIVTSNPIKAGEWCADDATALSGIFRDTTV